MDALNNISQNVPTWHEKLSTLSETITQRQEELALINEPAPPKTIKHRGSTESLRPQDEILQLPQDTNDNDDDDELLRPSPHQLTAAAIGRASSQALAVAHARARAQVRKKQRTASVTSVDVEEKPSKYRSRRMIIVYYDSFVQCFFEELVKFVSASRNLIRKAKMTAKVAHIKRVAEMESQNDDDDSSLSADRSMPGAPIAPRLPSLRYNARSARLGSYGIGLSKPTDAYDLLDKALEFIQSQSEKGAHQFLRDGDCTDEINNISRRMIEARDVAQREITRILSEEPELARDSGELNKVRTHRPTSMRRDFMANKPGGVSRAPAQPIVAESAREAMLAPAGDNKIIEVDTSS
ncbi:hypothetical protein TD95_005068 [Thielaviopsis punctulata]|uniref:Uncharacterized protein n=1 Tax=Thielaviopsis punctulata TaxID=72032 RepID=A0A0F4Z9G8_9PEZI|nr:hypothetical protein TD95_005068 [Thielaviopsis punctulata]